METTNESLPERVPRRATPVLVPTGCRTRAPTQMDILRPEPSPKRILSSHWMKGNGHRLTSRTLPRGRSPLRAWPAPSVPASARSWSHCAAPSLP